MSTFCKNKIICDSHARGCADELSHHLGRSFEAKGAVMPGSRLENITLLANSEIKTLHRDNFVTVYGGLCPWYLYLVEG
jgi:hypothetical protein